MNRSVPTLLGIVIILLVVVLVFTIFNYKLYSGLAGGGRVVGTAAHGLLTGQEPLTEEPAAPSAVEGAQAAEEAVVPGNVQPGQSERLATDTRTRQSRSIQRGSRGSLGTDLTTRSE